MADSFRLRWHAVPIALFLAWSLAAIEGHAVPSGRAEAQEPALKRPNLGKKLGIDDPIIIVPDKGEGLCLGNPSLCPPQADRQAPRPTSKPGAAPGSGRRLRDLGATRGNVGTPGATAKACDEGSWAPRPQALLDELQSYKSSEDFRQCQAASTVLRQRRCDKTGNCPPIRTFEGVPLDIVEAYLQEMRTYRQACIRPATALARTTSVPASIREPVENGAGFFIFDGDDAPYCTGFRIGNFIATARHCLAWDSRIRSPVLIQASFRFAHFGRPHERARVRLARAAHTRTPIYDPAQPETDWLVLELAEPLAPLTKASTVALPRQWQSLLIYGTDPSARLITEAEMRLGRDRHSFSEAQLRQPTFDYATTCFVPFVEHGLFFHGCQTDPGLSGAPVFAVVGAQPQLVGIHIGVPIPNDRRPCAAKYDAAAPNAAVILPEAIRRLLNEAAARR